ncbi:23966_t:CDS:1 [Dentiscutata erythropus]|uniref:23966_t:CDS:1 n=1 Tax=Dentiscutata erythropus TaxID=1348616 RepID=A0A9N9H2Z7_9GLOM|nr:23966_t:CDS:1 [Dentiscutata erythropus]
MQLHIHNETWPNITKIAYTSLLVVLAISPDNSQLNITTNSSSLNSLNNVLWDTIPNSYEQLRRQPFSKLLLLIRTTIITKDLILNISRTKITSKINPNIEKIKIKLDTNQTNTQFYRLAFHNVLTFINFKEIIKTTQIVHNLDAFTSLHRVQNWNNNQTTIKWNTIFKYLQFKDKPLYYFTDQKSPG